MNPYYDRLATVISEFAEVFEDKKITIAEVWALVHVIWSETTAIAKEAIPFTEVDCELVIDAAQEIYDEHIVPLDLPGPDRVLDPLVRRVIIPNLIHGVHDYFAKTGAAAPTDDLETE